MMMRHKKNQRGFSLIELGIVLGVIGIMIGGVWAYAGSGRQNTRVEQSVELVATSADALRGTYGGGSSISGGVSSVVPEMVQTGALPSNLMRSATSSCSGVTSNYPDTPWAGTYDACGTLRYCAWNYGTNTLCGTPNNPTTMQYFAIEFTQLDYGSCMAVAERVTPTSPKGMIDVFINGVSAVYNGAANSGLPVAPSIAAAKCTNAKPPANTLDFIYTLRTPTS